MKKPFISLGLIALLLCAAHAFGDATTDLKAYISGGHRGAAWNEFIEPGFKAFEQQNIPTAYVFLSKAYEKGCRDGLVLYKLALVYAVQNRDADALKVMEEALPKLKKDYATLEASRDVDAQLGILYYRADQNEKALPLLEQALKLTPNDFTLLFITGQVLVSLKRPQDAYARYREALALPVPQVTPDPTAALLKQLMLVSFELKKYDESMAYAEKILALDPKNAAALSYRDRINRTKIQMDEDRAIDNMMKRIQ